MSRSTWGGIIGLAQRLAPCGAHRDTLEEAIFECVCAALADAGVGIADVSGVVTASSDQLDGRAISLMVTSGSVGGPGRDIVNVSSSGEHALIVAATRAAVGTHPLQLVVSWGRPSEASPSALDGVAREPFFTRAIGLSDRSAQALAAGAYVRDHGLNEREAAAFVAVATRQAARGGGDVEKRTPDEVLSSPWVAWPLREAHFAPPADGVVALVLASEEAARTSGGSAAWIRGLAWNSGSYWLADRGYDAAASSARAIRRAFDLAACSQEDLQCWEWHFTNPYQAFATVEAVGLCGPGEGPAWLAAGPAGHLTAGGAYVGDTLFSTGLSQVVTAVRQVTGRAGSVQVPGARMALAHAVSGFAGQNASAFVVAS